MPCTAAAPLHTGAHHVDRVALGLVAIIALTEAALGVVVFALAPQFPLTGLGYGERDGARLAGYALAAYGAAKLPGQPASGWLVDRTAPGLVLYCGLLLTLPVIVAMDRVRVIAVFISGCALVGLTLSGVWPAVFALAGTRFAPSVQGRLMALISAGQLIGTVAGFGGGALLIDHVSYRAAFQTGLVLTALALGAAGVTVRAHGWGQTKRLVPREKHRGSVRSLLTSASLLLVLLLTLVSTATAMLAPDVKPYSEHVLGVAFSTVALLLVPPALVGAALLVPAGYLADRVGRVTPMAVGLGLFALALFALPTARSLVVATAIACAAVAGYVLCLPAISASLLDVSSHGRRGLFTGVASSMQALGLVLGPLLGGSVVYRFGVLAPFRLAAALVATSALIALLYGARRRRDAAHDGETMVRRRLSDEATGVQQGLNVNHGQHDQRYGDGRKRHRADR